MVARPLRFETVETDLRYFIIRTMICRFTHRIVIIETNQLMILCCNELRGKSSNKTIMILRLIFFSRPKKNKKKNANNK